MHTEEPKDKEIAVKSIRQVIQRNEQNEYFLLALKEVIEVLHGEINKVIEERKQKEDKQKDREEWT